MKKRSITIALTAFASLATLAGCSKPVTPKDGYLLSMSGKDGETVSISAEEFFNKYLKTKAGIKGYYDALYEVVVRELFESKLVTKRAELYEEAKQKVASAKEDAKKNATADSNYDKEFQKVLDDNGVENEDELLEKFAYDLMKVEVKDQFYDAGQTSWAPNAWKELVVGERDENGNLIVDDNGKPVYEGYLNAMIPYHVRHLLVKVDAGNKTYYNGAIRKEQATKLGGVVKALAERPDYDTFGKITKSLTDDDNTREVFGEFDPVVRTTPFNHEFKLGIYAFEGIYSSKATPEEKAKLEIPAHAQTALEDIGLGEIPYGAAIQLMNVAEYETDVNGNKVKEGSALLFPRNIYFNKYFNKHNVSVITPNDTNPADEVGTVNDTYAALPGFREVPELGGKKVLTDEKGNVILVVRAGTSGSYEGVHFIVIERSPLFEEVNGVTLENYYTIETPESKNYPKDEDGNPLDTYVNAITTDAKGYKDRSRKIKDGIKSFDTRIDDRIFAKLVKLLNVKIHDQELKKNLDEYLANELAIAEYDADLKMLSAWEEWINLLAVQAENRTPARLVDEACAIAFREAGTAPEYEEGGLCDKYV